MKRLMLAMVLTVACALALTGCASGAAHYTVRAVTGFVPLADDGRVDCTSTPVVIPAAATDSVWARAEWRQSATVVKADSVRTSRGVTLAFQPPSEVANATQVTVTVWLRDVGGTSCSASINLTPAQTLVRPGAFTGLTVVP